ncbi:MAG TPA: hypothetical protein VFM29_02050, partial [Vicinamibacteria bacterium]|nr:hypothetical protein [Vicinamibacteria bacterium]
VLAAAPCADAWAVPARPRSAVSTGDYGWALRLMWLFVAEIYLFGAIGKLRAEGLSWFAADNIRRNLVQFEHMHPGFGDPLTRLVADSPLLLTLGGAAVLALEAGFVACLFSRRARWVLVPAAVVFHLAILWSMQIVFANVVHLALFVDWGALADRLGGAPALTGA